MIGPGADKLYASRWRASLSARAGGGLFPEIAPLSRLSCELVDDEDPEAEAGIDGKSLLISRADTRNVTEVKEDNAAVEVDDDAVEVDDDADEEYVAAVNGKEAAVGGDDVATSLPASCKAVGAGKYTYSIFLLPTFFCR